MNSTYTTKFLLMSSTTDLFIKETIHFLELNPPRIENCLNRLTETQVWQKPNQVSNSIGNLILHLCGNITQYVIAGLGGAPDERKRDLEFSAHEIETKATLLEKINQVTNQAIMVLQKTAPTEFLRTRKVQGFDMTGVGIAIHVTEHYSYHVGQIALLTKLMVAEDLGFYADMDLNITGS